MKSLSARRWHNLVLAAFSDSQPGDAELAHLERMRVRLGLSTDETTEIEAELSTGGQDLELEMSPLQIRQTLRDVIRLFLVDGKLDPQERVVIDRVAGHIGLSTEEVDVLIDICRSAQSVRMPRVKRDDLLS